MRVRDSDGTACKDLPPQSLSGRRHSQRESACDFGSGDLVHAPERCELKQLFQSFFQWNSLSSKEAEFVKVAALENDLSVLDLEESASAHTQWVRPFKNRPFSVLK